MLDRSISRRSSRSTAAARAVDQRLETFVNRKESEVARRPIEGAQFHPLGLLARHDVLPIRIYCQGFGKLEHTDPLQVLQATRPSDAVDVSEPIGRGAMTAQFVRYRPKPLDIVWPDNETLKQLSARLEEAEKVRPGNERPIDRGEQGALQS